MLFISFTDFKHFLFVEFGNESSIRRAIIDAITVSLLVEVDKVDVHNRLALKATEVSDAHLNFVLLEFAVEIEIELLDLLLSNGGEGYHGS
jgi:hypothetical protein